MSKEATVVQGMGENTQVPNNQTVHTIGLQSIASSMRSRIQLCRKKSYEELSRGLGLHLNGMELRAGCSLHEIPGYYMGKLRWKPSHTLGQHFEE